jgi:acetyltransferase-like isoleucine patch superfamily enzyme
MMIRYLKLSTRAFLFRFGNILPPGYNTNLNRSRNSLFRFSGIKIQEPVHIDWGFKCSFPNNISIGKYVCLGNDSQLIAFQPIEIGDYTIGAAQLLIITGSHDKNSFEPLDNQKVVIGKGCWIGARVTILGGVNIGDGAIVGACSLVKNNVPPLAIVAGVPAKVIGYREPSDKVWNQFGYYDYSILNLETNNNAFGSK